MAQKEYDPYRLDNQAGLAAGIGAFTIGLLLIAGPQQHDISTSENCPEVPTVNFTQELSEHDGEFEVTLPSQNAIAAARTAIYNAESLDEAAEAATDSLAAYDVKISIGDEISDNAYELSPLEQAEDPKSTIAAVQTAISSMPVELLKKTDVEEVVLVGDMHNTVTNNEVYGKINDANSVITISANQPNPKNTTVHEVLHAVDAKICDGNTENDPAMDAAMEIDGISHPESTEEYKVDAMTQIALGEASITQGLAEVDSSELSATDQLALDRLYFNVDENVALYYASQRPKVAN